MSGPLAPGRGFAPDTSSEGPAGLAGLAAKGGGAMPGGMSSPARRKPQYAIDPEDAAASDDAAAPIRRALAQAYGRYGMPGVLRLMPREAAFELKRFAREGRKCRKSLWRRLGKLLSNPDVLLLGLVLAFVAMVMWGARAEPAMPAMTSLHMSPFPLGTS